MSTSDDFNWNTAVDEGTVVVRHQPAIAVYTNPHDEVVIRQEGHYGPDEDQFIYLTRENVRKVVNKVLEVGGFASITETALMAARPDIDWHAVLSDFNESGIACNEEASKPKDGTAAERAKRYRENKKRERDAHRDEPVTVAPRLLFTNGQKKEEVGAAS
jgi:hypothetical protein